MKVLFARIGYMKFYSGPKPGDEKPLGGGAYNKNEIGHEVYNFAVNEDHVIKGYYQPNMIDPYEINLSRIDPKVTHESEKVDDVLVIWFAKHPIENGQVIIGWYKHATVFRRAQKPKPGDSRGDFDYYILAKSEDCTLLPISNRKFKIGHGKKGEKRGNPGQANSFYIRNTNGDMKDLEEDFNQWIKNAIEYCKLPPKQDSLKVEKK